MRSGRLPAGRGLAVLGAVALVGAVLAGCGGAGAGTVSTTAEFSDVNQLANGAQVEMADVPVGRVTDITLDGDRARVTMAINRSAHVPADVTAVLDQTSVLGENFVNLEPAHGASGALLADGSVIRNTAVAPEAEQLVGAGTSLFQAVPTGDLAAIIDAGGQGFAGQAASLRQLLNDFSTVAAGYAGQTGQITALIDNLDQLGSGLAPSAQQDAQAITNLAQTTAVLAQESGRFTQLLQSLDTLSIQGRSILETYFPQITDQLQALASTSQALAQHQQDLAGLLKYLPVHDATAQGATVDNYLQVLNNIIVCGIPGGGADNSAPASACLNPGGKGGGQ